MQTLQCISFMTAATGPGALQVQLQTYDLLANVTVTLNVSGIAGNETTFQLGQIVNTQLNTFLFQNKMAYQNIPPLGTSQIIPPFLSFPDQAYNAMFNVTWTEHVVTVMSQCNFSITITSNTIGCKTWVDWNPVLVDLPTAKTDGAVLNILWEDPYGNLLSDDQIITNLVTASSKMCNFLRNNIVLTTYLYYEISNGQKSVFLPKIPVRDFFAPVIRRPIIFSIQQITANATVKSNFMLDRNRGELGYRFSQDFLYSVEPFDDGNEVMIAYVSGFQRIPSVIKEYTIKLGRTARDSEFDSMQGEGSRFNFKSTENTLKGWAAWLSPYYSS